MASGRVHVGAWARSLAPAAVAAGTAWLFAVPAVREVAPAGAELMRWRDYSAFMAGWTVSVLAGPDLDLEGYDYTERFLLRWLYPIGVVYVLFWLAYARAARHRSRLSHGLVTGTLGRWLYVVGMIFALAGLWALQAEALRVIGAWGSARAGWPAGWLAGDTAYGIQWWRAWVVGPVRWIVEHRQAIAYYLAGVELSSIWWHYRLDWLTPPEEGEGK